MTSTYNPGPRFTRRSAYGRRIDPTTGKEEFHAGLDFAAPVGTPIPAATSGVVVYSGLNKGFGNVVILKNDAGGYSLYGHMQDGDRAELGRRIWQGDTLGFVGSTGKSTGAHLHYAVIADQAGNAIAKSNAPRDGGSIGVKLNEFNTFDPARYDPTPRYLDETRRAAQMMSGTRTGAESGGGRPDARSSSVDRFGNWASAPAGIALPPASDRPDTFDNRFGNWGSVPASPSGETSAPVLRALENYRRSVTPNAAPSPSAPRAVAPTALSAQAPAVRDRPQNTDNAAGSPARLLGRKVTNPSPASAYDPGAPTAPIVPSDEPNISGGLLGRLVALMGIDPQNPTQPVTPPLDDQLRGFYRDDPIQPWLPRGQR